MDDQPIEPEDLQTRFNRRLNGRIARHNDFTQASGYALRARGQLIQEEIAKERFGLQRQKQELDRIKTLAEITRQTVLIKQQMQAHEHVQGALSKLKDLDPVGDPNGYTIGMAKVFSDHPMATRDPIVQGFVRTQIGSMQAKQKADRGLETLRQEEAIRIQAAVQKEDALMRGRMQTAGSEEYARGEARNFGKSQLAAQKEVDDPAAKVNTAIAGGKVTGYGTFDGTAFTATDKAKGTHVQVEYQDPKTGKYGVSSIPVESYQTAVMANTPATEAAPSSRADDFINSQLK
tara:strand:- start:13906 stop:14775 length:870 start_codon:yes stop_codon:yes gene_type:complete